MSFIGRQVHARPLMCFAVCFLLGIIGAQLIALPLFALVAMAVLSGFIYWIVKKRLYKQLSILFLLAAFLFGCARMQLAYRAYPEIAPQFSIAFEGEVISEPYCKASTDRLICDFRVRKAENQAVDYKVRLYLRSEVLPLEGIEYGQTISCFGHIWPQEHASNPYQFDQVNWLLSDGLSGMAAAKLEDVQISPAEPSMGTWIIGIRHAVSDRIDLLFPKNADLVRAFVLGDRSTLDDDLRDDFNKTGIAHLISISGMHISVLAAALSAALRKVLSKNVSIGLTAAAILVYGFLIGYPPSLVRATVMFLAFSLANVSGRPSDTMTNLGLALLVMLSLHPFHIYDCGFILSFAASAGINLLTPSLAHLLGVDRLRRKTSDMSLARRTVFKSARYVLQLLCSSLAAQLATLPAVIYYFGMQSILAIPMNLLAVPLAMVAYPLALIALVVSGIQMGLGALFAQVPDTMFSLLVFLTRRFAALPVGSIQIPCYPVWLVGVHCAIIVAASNLSKVSLEIRKWMPIALMFCLAVSACNAFLHTLGFSVVFLDAGQADAAVLRTQGHVYLIDVGDAYSPSANYASGSFVKIDAIFLSHPHYDHAGGLLKVLERMLPQAIYVPQGWFAYEAVEVIQEGIAYAREKNIPIIELSAGDQVQLSEDAVLTVLAPQIGESNSVNALSMIVEVQYGNMGALFTGDMEMRDEIDSFPDIDLLKVPHHGSNKASSEHMLMQTTPEVAVIPVGENNYGHPSAETIGRIEAVGSKVYRTDVCGAITVYMNPDSVTGIDTYFPLEAQNEVE